MNDQGDDRRSDNRGNPDPRPVREQVHRDQHRDDRAADIHRDDRRAGLCRDWHLVANSEAAHHGRGMQVAARDSRDRNIDVTADQACEQRRERHLRWQPERHERVVDYMNLDQDEKEREQKKEKDRVEEQEGREKHGAIISGLPTEWVMAPVATLSVSETRDEAPSRTKHFRVSVAHRAFPIEKIIAVKIAPPINGTAAISITTAR